MTLAAVAALLAASAAAGAARPPVSLIASPAHVSLAGTARAGVVVTNSGTEPVVVDVTRAGFALDLHGRPGPVARRSSWLAVGPRQLVLAPGAAATLTVSARVPRRAQPGDHSELVLLSTRPSVRRGLPVRVRLGVVVVVRAPGKVVHRVGLLGLRSRRAGRGRRLEVLVANTGNVTEHLGGTCMTVTVHRGARILTRLRGVRRDLLPHSRGVVDVRYAGKARGPVVVRVVLLRACGGPRVRAFAVRL
ncbi:MAG TPA: hypothetical protein VFB35_04770 [Gaiellaceae bacterium]|nr:hypothetical protein [Gaiellaceae bacterium]